MLMLLLDFSSAMAQDPHFSQFFMAPQLVNPALTGVSEGKWRVMGNFRQQWQQAGTSFHTGVMAGEMKIPVLSGQSESDKEGGTIAASAACMFDQSMYGAFKSSYGIVTLAYQQDFSDENRGHHFGIGFHSMYGNRSIDYSKLNFGEQFSSGDFDVSLPSGEIALTSMKPFFSFGTGLYYHYKMPTLRIGAGGSIFHLNGPRQTFLNDPMQIIPRRYVANMNIEYRPFTSAPVTYNFTSIFMRQGIQSYFSVGGAVGRMIARSEEDESLSKWIYFGGWFREGDAFYPYAGLGLGRLQLGFTYDVTHSRQNQGPSIPQSAEVSFVLRDLTIKSGKLPCPVLQGSPFN